MPGGWRGSTRSDRLPSDWASTRRPRIRARDNYQCTAVEDGQRCTGGADQVDHIDPNGPEDDSNYTSLCTSHHGKKSAAEGNEARWRYRRQRPPEPHPGLR